MGAGSNYSIERKKLVMQERGVIDGATSLKREVMASGQGGGREASVMQKDGRLMWNGEGGVPPEGFGFLHEVGGKVIG